MPRITPTEIVEPPFSVQRQYYNQIVLCDQALAKQLAATLKAFRHALSTGNVIESRILNERAQGLAMALSLVRERSSMTSNDQRT